MRIHVRATLGIAVAAAACLPVTACGTPDPLANTAGKQISAKAIADTKAAPSFTMKGSSTQQGQTGAIDIGITDGNRCTGSISLNSHGSMDLVLIGKTVWLKFDSSMWKYIGHTEAGSKGAQIGTMLGQMFSSKYIEVKPGDKGASDLTSMTKMCTPSEALSDMNLSNDTVKGPVTTVAGKKVLTLSDKKKDTSMTVTDAAKPQIVTIIDKQPKNKGQVTVVYGTPTSVSPPPSYETVDASKAGL